MKPEDITRVTVGLTRLTMDRLDQICLEKGIRRPAAISIAIEKLWKEEHTDKQ